MFFKCIVCFVYIVVSVECVFRGDPCSADDQPGTCELLSRCSHLLNEIRRAGTPMPSRVRRKLLRLGCGFEFDAPLVCCESKISNIPRPITSRPSSPWESDEYENDDPYTYGHHHSGENENKWSHTRPSSKPWGSNENQEPYNTGGETNSFTNNGGSHENHNNNRWDTKPNSWDTKPDKWDTKPSKWDTEPSNWDTSSKPNNWNTKPNTWDTKPNNNWGTSPKPWDTKPSNWDTKPNNWDTKPSNWATTAKPSDNWDTKPSNWATTAKPSDNWDTKPSNWATTAKPSDNWDTKPDSLDTSKNTNDNSIERIPDVRNHRNLNLLSTECGAIEGERIFGGNRTNLFEMPWMVLLSYDSARGTKLSCGGTLITEWYVLTAAHCISNLGSKLKLKSVILGEYDVRRDPDCERMEGELFCAPKVRNVGIGSLIPHPDYTPQQLGEDIGLIRLAEPADFSLDSMKTICLPTTPELQSENLEGLNGVVAGWGATEDGLQSPVLLSVDLPIISNSDCQAIYNGSPPIQKSQLCAGGVPDKDSCGGDSGGPLVYPGRTKAGVRYVQRGIVSYGSKRCGLGGFPGVYTRVANYMDWILDNISG